MVLFSVDVLVGSSNGCSGRVVTGPRVSYSVLLGTVWSARVLTVPLLLLAINYIKRVHMYTIRVIFVPAHHVGKVSHALSVICNRP